MIRMAMPQIGEEERRAVLEVLDSGMLAQGERVRALEERFAALCGVRHAVATSNGTTALHAALLALGVGPGDEVITSSFSFIASGNAILFTGARPVFVDVRPDTLNLDPGHLEAAITPRTRVIMPVHLYGNPADMAAIEAIARRHALRILEDACQAHGATVAGRRVGSFDVAAFSFYGTKNMTTGEGGMVTTDDAAVAERCRMLRNHGQSRRYYHDSLGYNFRLTDLQAALGLCQLDRLEAATERRIAHAAYYSEVLPSWLTPPVATPGARHVYHQYTVRAPGCRDELARHLAEQGVQTIIYYPVPIHRQRAYLEMGFDQSLPETERAAAEVLSLPVHPLLTAEDLDRVRAALESFPYGRGPNG